MSSAEPATPNRALNDANAVMDVLKSLVRRFTDARDWHQFHHPKDLGLALAIEVGEVLEHFRYRDNNDIVAHLRDPAAHTEFAHELADCLWLLLRLADVTGVDLTASLVEKLALADKKYPADLVRGRSHKYTHYQRPRRETDIDGPRD